MAKNAGIHTISMNKSLTYITNRQKSNKIN